MLKRNLITLSALLVTSLSFTACKKKVETPAFADLQSRVELNFVDYKQTYQKDEDGFYSISKLQSRVILRQSGNFYDEEVVSGMDSTLPDLEAGEYNRIKLIAADTLAQQYNSPIAGKLQKDHIKCNVKPDSGSFENLAKGEELKLSYTDAGKAELTAMYSTQLEKQYAPMVTDMMWAELEKRTSDLFTPAEVRERYRIKVSAAVAQKRYPKTEIIYTADSATIEFKGTLWFAVEFTGAIEILK